jgi:hypothetical protein
MPEDRVRGMIEPGTKKCAQAGARRGTGDSSGGTTLYRSDQPRYDQFFFNAAKSLNQPYWEMIERAEPTHMAIPTENRNRL